MDANLAVSDIKVFAPTKDFQVSLLFYEQLGWRKNWENEGLAELELGGQRFFLQKYYHKGWANNFMFYINVEDVQAWYDRIKQVIDEGDFGKARYRTPTKQAHGDIVCHVWDPCGVLLHFAESEK